MSDPYGQVKLSIKGYSPNCNPTYFDDQTNLDVLQQIQRKLTPHGRLILDVYHRGYFEQHEGMRTMRAGDVTVTENKFMRGNRLSVTLDYGPGRAPDAFEWRLYTPEELVIIAQPLGLKPLVVCSDFREQQQKQGAKPPPGPAGPVKRDLEIADQLAAARQDPAYHFVIEPGGKPLADDVGLFVYTAKREDLEAAAAELFDVVKSGKVKIESEG